MLIHNQSNGRMMMMMMVVVVMMMMATTMMMMTTTMTMMMTTTMTMTMTMVMILLLMTMMTILTTSTTTIVLVSTGSSTTYRWKNTPGRHWQKGSRTSPTSWLELILNFTGSLCSTTTGTTRLRLLSVPVICFSLISYNIQINAVHLYSAMSIASEALFVNPFI